MSFGISINIISGIKDSVINTFFNYENKNADEELLIQNNEAEQEPIDMIDINYQLSPEEKSNFLKIYGIDSAEIDLSKCSIRMVLDAVDAYSKGEKYDLPSKYCTCDI